MPENNKTLGDIIFDEKSKLESDILELLSEFTKRTGFGVFEIRYSRQSEAGCGFRPNEFAFNLSVVVGIGG